MTEECTLKFPISFQPLFKESLITEFLIVFLRVLSDRSHDLLRDEIVSSVHSMASVDFDAFFRHFLPQFLQQVEGIDDSQRNMLKESFKEDSVRVLNVGF